MSYPTIVGKNTDEAAIHDNVSSEISAIAEKIVIASADLLLLEDSADTFSKKKMQVSNLTSEVKIDEITGAAATYDFTSIPQTFTHLRIEGSVRTDRAANGDVLRMRINNNSTADDHVSQSIQSNAGSVTGNEFVTDETSVQAASVSAATATALYFDSLTIWLPDYTATSKAPKFHALSFRADGVATGDLFQVNYAGMLDVAGAVTRLTFFPSLGTNIVTGSILSLYGVR